MISTQKQNFSGWSCAPFSLCYKHWFPAYILCHVLHPAHTLPRNKPLSKPNKSMWDCAWHEQSPVVSSWEGNSRQCLDLILGILSGINMWINGISKSDIIKNFLKVFSRNHQGYKLGNRFIAEGAGINLHATAKKSTLTNLKKTIFLSGINKAKITSSIRVQCGTQPLPVSEDVFLQSCRLKAVVVLQSCVLCCRGSRH